LKEGRNFAHASAVEVSLAGTFGKASRAMKTARHPLPEAAP
jgi:hypothetical protein